MKVRPNDLPVYCEEVEWMKSLNSDLYPHLTLKYKEFGSVNYLCRAINRRNSDRKNDVFHFNYSIKMVGFTLDPPLRMK